MPAPRRPIGSPYGFTPDDWNEVERRQQKKDVLYIVLGYQFQSEWYNSTNLKRNVELMFGDAANRYNNRVGHPDIKTDFRSLAAGYGGHLFNQIARDIISADIAIFETSDLNPNVMIELGVALTWGVQVLPIKKEGRPKPPSDISGQTWADYADDGTRFIDSDHDRNHGSMIENAIRMKRSK